MPDIDPSVLRAIGLWRRVSFAVDEGPADRTTAVFWGQTARRYIDVRIPAGRPRWAAADVSGLSEVDLAGLARQQGFAGDLAVAGDRFTWHRDLDFQPPCGRPDTGLVRIEGDRLYEEGEAAQPGSVYRETFERIASGDRRRVALRAAAWPGSGSSPASSIAAELVIIDDHFLFARDRPARLSAAEALGPLLFEARRAAPEGGAALLDCEFAKGRLAGGDGRWIIEASTLPWREGTAAFAPCSARLDCDTLTVETPSGSVRWTVADSTLPASELVRLFGDDLS